MASGASFDPKQHLTTVNGRDYLETRWRLVWLRLEHPEAQVRTEMVKLDEDLALFKAEVAIRDGGSASGWGMESSRFPDYAERAEARALNRALAALGYGSQYVDDYPLAGPVTPAAGQTSQPSRPKTAEPDDGAAVTTTQLRLLYDFAKNERQMSERELDEKCKATYGVLPAGLSRAQAAELLETLK
jgi:hypothetical protein